MECQHSEIKEKRMCILGANEWAKMHSRVEGWMANRDRRKKEGRWRLTGATVVAWLLARARASIAGCSCWTVLCDRGTQLPLWAVNSRQRGLAGVMAAAGLHALLRLALKLPVFKQL